MEEAENSLATDDIKIFIARFSKVSGKQREPKEDPMYEKPTRQNKKKSKGYINTALITNGILFIFFVIRLLYRGSAYFVQQLPGQES